MDDQHSLINHPALDNRLHRQAYAWLEQAYPNRLDASHWQQHNELKITGDRSAIYGAWYHIVRSFEERGYGIAGSDYADKRGVDAFQCPQLAPEEKIEIAKSLTCVSDALNEHGQLQEIALLQKYKSADRDPHLAEGQKPELSAIAREQIDQRLAMLTGSVAAKLRYQPQQVHLTQVERAVDASNQRTR